MHIQWIGSPNFWPGRTQPVTELVQHWTVGSLASADATFQNRATSTSAGYGIENHTIHQYVRDEDRAWHALQANHWAIGIEHSAGPGRPATDATYEASIWLNAHLCRKFGLNPDVAIVPHNKHVNTQCPGTLDLNRIKQGVKQLLGGDVIIGNGANWWARMNRLHHQLVGNWDMNDEVWRSIQGKPTWQVVENWSDHENSNQLIADARLGELARKDKWDQQIYGLQERAAQLTKQVEELSKKPEDSELMKAIQERLAKTEKELKEAGDAINEAKTSAEQAKVEFNKKEKK